LIFGFRGNYGRVSNSDISFFTNVIGKSHVITDPYDIEKCNIDWIRTVRGQSKVSYIVVND